MKKLAALFGLVMILAVPTSVLAAKPGGGGSVSQLPGSPYVSGTVGADISYPQCGGSNPGGAFGVVGVTGGVVYSQNSCLGAEAKFYGGKLSLYMNTGLNADPVNSNYYRDAQAGCNGDAYCAAYNYGANAAVAAYNYALSQGVSSATWWLDVETTNTWNGDAVQNQRALQGAADALHQRGVVNVGVYSTTEQWGSITGGWQNGWPNWGATIVRQASQAAGFCTGHQFTGGPTWLIQFSGKVDQDYAC